MCWRSGDRKAVSTSRATVPHKCRIFSNLDDSTRDFLNYISSTDSEDNDLSLDFSTESDNASNRVKTWYPCSTQAPENAKVSEL